jgi:hypothetical protein
MGSILANYVVNLKVTATSTLTAAVILYNITAGSLPHGLTLSLDGEIMGMVNQFSNIPENIVGLTTFDYEMHSTTFDNGGTSFDREFHVTIQARDRSGYSAISRTFIILVETHTQVSFSNIRAKPLLKMAQRELWKDFINDNSIFTSANIYRINDSYFGVQTELSMMIYAGIETTDAGAYAGAMGLNHKRKRFQFGVVKKALAIDQSMGADIYEVIYVEMIDPLEPNNKRLPMTVHQSGQYPQITVDNSSSIWSRSINDLTNDAPSAVRPLPIMTVDSSGYFISTATPSTYFPNSISNWRDRLKEVGESERNYLPLWMRTIQPGTSAELGFTLAVPLCYCKVGMADDIMINIKHSGFDFKLLDYTTDRFIIDTLDNSASDKYLVFRNDRITI